MGREYEHDDLDLLEAHLDGALAPDDAEALARRLGREPALAAALERVRETRAVRRAVWASYEPQAGHAERLTTAFVAAGKREERIRRAARLARRATAAAAVVLLAFAGGWVARGRLADEGASVARPVSTDDHAFDSSGAGDGPSFPVALTDEDGNIVAVQHFDDPDRAREFAEDVGRWQSRPAERQQRPTAERSVPVSGEF